MRNVPNLKANRYRVRNGLRASDDRDGNNGVFLVPFSVSIMLQVCVSDGMGWDHVSVSLPHREPTYAEMEHVRQIFFRDEECCMQLSVPRSDHVNVHDHCLHWWRPQSAEEIAAVRTAWEAAGEEWPWPDLVAPPPIPRPPKECV